MSKKICKLVKKGDEKVYKALLQNPKFVCKKCGRVANKSKVICKSKALKTEEKA